jgi:NADPH2:quinone reductase
MHAVAAHEALPISDPASLVDIEIDMPSPGPHDVVVRVEAASLNPVDVKQRQRVARGGSPRVLGYDGAGTVTSVGDGVDGFAVGDEVYYAGAINRPGSNADFQAVDHRIVAHKPTNLSFADSAALPLTALTALETLEDHLRVDAQDTGTLLMVGGAGGVGSIMTQLAKQMTGLRVIATASREESRAWCLSQGADDVVGHHAIADEVPGIAPDGVDYVLSSYSAGQIPAFAKVLKPYGSIVAIDDGDFDLAPLKPKSISWHWEFMFTRSLYQTPDIGVQGRMLADLAGLVDAGKVTSTATHYIDDFTATGFREAHRLLETHGVCGKVVVVR